MAEQAGPANLSFALTPVQIGDQIWVQIQVGTSAGLSTTLLCSQDVARQFSRGIKEAVEKAETTIVKPQSRIASA